MKGKHDKLDPPAKGYLEKAKSLSKKEAERLLSRLKGRFVRRLEDKKFSEMELIALQLELEDEQLKEWRKRVAEIRIKSKGK